MTERSSALGIGASTAIFSIVTLGVGVAVLIVAGVVASVIPARRAASIDPMTVLRQD